MTLFKSHKSTFTRKVNYYHLLKNQLNICIKSCYTFEHSKLTIVKESKTKIEV